jgi:hypothetical protein
MKQIVHELKGRTKNILQNQLIETKINETQRESKFYLPPFTENQNINLK